MWASRGSGSKLARGGFNESAQRHRNLWRADPGRSAVRGAVNREGYSLEEAKASVGPGWGPLLDVLFRELVGTNINVIQVKEKFGGLRIYLDRYTDEMDWIIRRAKLEASQHCEKCGTTDEVWTGTTPACPYWIKTLCQDCFDERDLK